MVAPRADKASTHGVGCGCDRCVAFGPGNEAALTHGAHVGRSKLVNDPETLAEAAEVRESMLCYAPAFEPTIEMFAITKVRLRRGMRAIDKLDAMVEDDPLRAYLVKDAPLLKHLRDDVRAWVRLCAELARELGLSPMSASRLGVNVTQARLGQSLLDRYAGDKS